MDSQIHSSVENYIVSNLSGIKYSLNANDPRDFSLSGAPLLQEGVDEHIIFNVVIERGVPVAIGNGAKRRVGTVRAEFYLPKNSTDREMLEATERVTSFLEQTSNDGVKYRDAVWTGGVIEIGKWRMQALTISFQKTVTN